MPKLKTKTENKLTETNFPKTPNKSTLGMDKTYVSPCHIFSLLKT